MYLQPLYVLLLFIVIGVEFHFGACLCSWDFLVALDVKCKLLFDIHTMTIAKTCRIWPLTLKIAQFSQSTILSLPRKYSCNLGQSEMNWIPGAKYRSEKYFRADKPDNWQHIFRFTANHNHLDWLLYCHIYGSTW